MATSVDYIEFVCEQIDKMWDAKYKKMFGEYMVYVNEKPIFLVCDNTVYVKILPELSSLLCNNETGLPYTNAKEHYVLDIEDRELLDKVVEILERVTPLPKKRNKK